MERSCFSVGKVTSNQPTATRLHLDEIRILLHPRVPAMYLAD